MEKLFNLCLLFNYFRYGKISTIQCGYQVSLKFSPKNNLSHLFHSVYLETHQDSSKFYTPASNTAVSLFRIVVNVSSEEVFNLYQSMNYFSYFVVRQVICEKSLFVVLVEPILKLLS